MATTEAESAAVEAMTGLFDGPNDGGDDDDEQEVDGAEAALVSMASGETSGSNLVRDAPHAMPNAPRLLRRPMRKLHRPLLLPNS